MRSARRAALVAVAVLVSLVATTVVADGAQGSRDGERRGRDTGSVLDAPVGLEGLADPHVIRFGDVWFAFGTSHAGVNVPVAMSSDLVAWTLVADALPAGAFPAWATGPVWAPGVIEAAPGRWLLYASTGWTGSWKRCITVAVADWPAGPYRAVTDRPLHCGATPEAWGAIDPFPYRGPDGRLYLAWKDTASPRQIWAAPLTDDGLAVAAAPTPLLDGEVGWEEEGIENPLLVPAAGAWWLLYSGGWWTDGRYAIGYAHCEGPLGPCAKVTRHAPWLGSGPGLVGPGGPSVAPGPTGEPWLAFHTWPADRPGIEAGGVRQLRTWPVRFTAGGPLLGSRPPVGVVETVTRTSSGGIRVTGWAADPDSPDQQVTVRLTVDGTEVGRAPTAVPRPALAALFGVRRQDLGFDLAAPVPAGSILCVEVEGTAPGAPGRLGCLTG